MKHFLTFLYFFFLILRFSWAQDPTFVLDDRIPDGVCKTVFVEGNTMYLGNGAAVDIYDISQADTSLFLGRLLTDGTVKKIFVSGNYAYIAESRLGVSIADISDPTNAEVVGSFVLNNGSESGLAEDVFVAGNHAYVAYGEEGLRVLDVSNPSSPFETAYILDDEQTLTYAYAVDVKDDYAYVANSGYGMNVIDVSNPAALVEIGAYQNSGTYPSFNDICVLDDIAFASADWKGLFAIDISDPANPFKMDTYAPGNLAISVYAWGDFAYLTEKPAGLASDSTVGLTVIDATDPFHLTGYDEYITPGHPYNVFAKDTLVFIADGLQMELLSMNTSSESGKTEPKSNKLLIIYKKDIEKIHKLSIDRDGHLTFKNLVDVFGESLGSVGVYDNQGHGFSFHATNSGLIFKDGDGVVTGGVPINGKFNPNAPPLFITQNDDKRLLYVTTDQEIAVFDITDLDNIARINTLTHPESSTIVSDVDEKRLVYTLPPLDLVQMDIDDPADPNPPSGTTTTSETVSGLCFDGDYIYVVEEFMLEIFNVEDIDNIIKESSTQVGSFPSFLTSVDVNFPRLVYTKEDGKVGLMDISDPSNPELLTEKQFDGSGSDIKFLNTKNYCAYAREIHGLSILNTDSNSISETSHYATGSMALRLYIAYSLLSPFSSFSDTTFYIYVADNEDGVYIYKSSPLIGVKENNDESGRFGLSQNYPNPFRSTTIIKYTVPKTAHIEIEVYNVLGEEITTLVNQKLQMGSYTVEWDGRNKQGCGVGSGIYFYTIKTSGYLTESRKMFLLKK